MLRSSTWLPLAVLLLVGILTAWLKILTEGSSDQASTETDNQPDMIVEKFEVRTFGQNGMVEAVVRAEQMVHYPQTDTADLTNIRYERQRANEPPMVVTAPAATADRKIDQLTLRDNVVLVRSADANHKALKIVTNSIVLDSDKGVAQTKDKVVAESPGTTIQSQGMHYTQDTQILKLYDVKATLLPPQAK